LYKAGMFTWILKNAVALNLCPEYVYPSAVSSSASKDLLRVTTTSLSHPAVGEHVLRHHFQMETALGKEEASLMRQLLVTRNSNDGLEGLANTALAMLKLHAEHANIRHDLFVGEADADGAKTTKKKKKKGKKQQVPVFQMKGMHKMMFEMMAVPAARDQIKRKGGTSATKVREASERMLNHPDFTAQMAQDNSYGMDDI